MSNDRLSPQAAARYWVRKEEATFPAFDGSSNLAAGRSGCEPSGKSGRDGHPAPDGSDLLEILLDDIVDRYVKFAEDHYETRVDPAAVKHVVARRPLTEVVVQALNPEATVAGLHEDIAVIGYPLAAA